MGGSRSGHCNTAASPASQRGWGQRGRPFTREATSARAHHPILLVARFDGTSWHRLPGTNGPATAMILFDNGGGPADSTPGADSTSRTPVFSGGTERRPVEAVGATNRIREWLCGSRRRRRSIALRSDIPDGRWTDGRSVGRSELDQLDSPGFLSSAASPVAAGKLRRWVGSGLVPVRGVSGRQRCQCPRDCPLAPRRLVARRSGPALHRHGV